MEKGVYIKYPCVIRPFVCEHIWGGSRLLREYGKTAPGTKLSEAWELSVHGKYPSYIDNGPYKGMSLRDYFSLFPEAILNAEGYGLLVKLIDSASLLSVQVHPDDEFALKHEGEPGKTEAWYILEADPGAFIYLGFKRDVTIEEYKEAVYAGTVEKLLNKVPVHPGQSFLVEAGTVHAIGGGITLLEVQENSSITYRVYDYNRKDKDGNKRELHIDKALQVTSLNKADRLSFRKYPVKFAGGAKVIAKCRYFTEYFADKPFTLNCVKACAVTTVSGASLISYPGGSLELKKGASAFIPAGLCADFSGQFTAVLTIEGDK